MRALIVVLGCVIGSRVAHADVDIAAQVGDKLTIYRATDKKLTKLYEEKVIAADFRFSNATTVWFVRPDGTSWAFGSIVDGKPGATYSIEAAKAPSLALDADGVVWAQYCKDADCKTPVFARVDGDKMVIASAKPNLNREGKAKPPIATPKGYVVTKTRHKVKFGTFSGLSCVGPRGRFAWKSQDRSMMSNEWVRLAPAVLRVDAKNPLERTDDPLLRELLLGDEVFFVEECKTRLEVVALYDNDLWVSTANRKAWKVRKGGKVIGTITGSKVALPREP